MDGCGVVAGDLDDEAGIGALGAGELDVVLAVVAFGGDQAERGHVEALAGPVHLYDIACFR